MEKIISSFKNLYADSDALKRHLLIAVLFILPAATGASLQFIDKDEKALIVPLLLTACIFAVLSIIPFFILGGLYFNFIHKRFSDAFGVPQVNMDCLIMGLKAFPVYLVWGIYIFIPCALYLAVVIGAFAVVLSGNPGPATAITSVLILMGLIFLLLIPLILISPFIVLVYFKYCENFEYSCEIFNPLTPFKYMAKAFKEVIIVAFKFIAVGIVTSFISQIIVMSGAIIMFMVAFIWTIFAGVVSGSDIMTSVSFIFITIAFSSILGAINGYITQMTQFAYVDNLLDVYKEKFLTEN